MRPSPIPVLDRRHQDAATSSAPARGPFAVTPLTTRLTRAALGGTLVAIAWVWVGRCLVTGQEGWMFLLLALWGWPAALLLLLPHALGRLRRTPSGERAR